MNSIKEISKSVIAIKGSARLSNFRLDSINKKLAIANKKIEVVGCSEVYFLSFKGALKADQLEQLKSILKAAPFEENLKEISLTVVPRFGTISPWSSKATEILHNSGLSFFQRIERGFYYSFDNSKTISAANLYEAGLELSDRMTENIILDLLKSKDIFLSSTPKPFTKIPMHKDGIAALEVANGLLGLALNKEEIEYLYSSYLATNSNPSDAELMMFAQANSEHCRHKIFNADWKIDGKSQPLSLFGMIRNTHKKNPSGILSAYEDNAAVFKGNTSGRFYPAGERNVYSAKEEPVHIVIKVETHNHPTAISPFSGAATGSGGEIRDEGATGIGAKPKAGLSGFSVSNLRIPALNEPWEIEENTPRRIATPLQIMLEAPIGAAAFNNEFGRPNILGYFRSFEMKTDIGDGLNTYGYHKPIMLAGGLGNIKEGHVNKKEVPIGSKLIVLGGPAMLIGLGGGSASSLASGSGDLDLDFASVQRENPEMERRCQEVLDRCWQKGSDNPILFIHDVGAGGLSNAVPELINDSGRGGVIQLRKIPNAEPGMSPMEIWCNESQERYVLAIEDNAINEFTNLCHRERCPFAVIGEITEGSLLEVYDEEFDNYPISLPLETLFGKPPKTSRSFNNKPKKIGIVDLSRQDVGPLLHQVLRHPTVASKNYLITIGDRTVTGLIVRDQMIGPWQVPVSDHCITRTSFTGMSGEAMSIGERTPCAILDPAAAARISVAEAVTNIMSSGIRNLSDLKLSANWMGAPDRLSGDQDLHQAVKTVGMDLCPKWGIAIPVGKDSLSMATDWRTGDKDSSVISPLSLVVSAFSALEDINIAITPQLKVDPTAVLLFIDLAKGNTRLGGSIASQVNQVLMGNPPDVECVEEMPFLVNKIHDLLSNKKILAYHDRSDGGLIATISEMAFAGRVGVDIKLDSLMCHGKNLIDILFNEELGVVVQVQKEHLSTVMKAMKECGLDEHTHKVGSINTSRNINLIHDDQIVEKWNLEDLLKDWNRVSYEMQSLRDNPETASQEYKFDNDIERLGLSPVLNFDLPKVMPSWNQKPLIAILREQGVNGQVEMAAAFDRSGFTCVDVHMTDLIKGKHELKDFKGLVACGGFSYGDVLGAGGGWATNILYNENLRKQFSEFFLNEEVFTLGVCNGCQTLALLQDLIPGSAGWPKFVRNTSEKFESRLVQTIVQESPSIFFKDMAGSVLPIPVAHGEGRVSSSREATSILSSKQLTPIVYADDNGLLTESYPQNPNGSYLGVAGVTNKSGRVTLMMPHPERVFLQSQYSWSPDEWEEYGPWMQFFMNAREFTG